jgi:hypothetical protein
MHTCSWLTGAPWESGIVTLCPGRCGLFPRQDGLNSAQTPLSALEYLSHVRVTLRPRGHCADKKPRLGESEWAPGPGGFGAQQFTKARLLPAAFCPSKGGLSPGWGKGKESPYNGGPHFTGVLDLKHPEEAVHFRLGPPAHRGEGQPCGRQAVRVSQAGLPA